MNKFQCIPKMHVYIKPIAHFDGKDASISLHRNNMKLFLKYRKFHVPSEESYDTSKSVQIGDSSVPHFHNVSTLKRSVIYPPTELLTKYMQRMKSISCHS